MHLQSIWGTVSGTRAKDLTRQVWIMFNLTLCQSWGEHVL